MLPANLLKVFLLVFHLIVTLTFVLLLFVGIFYFSNIYIKVFFCLLYLILFLFFYFQIYLLYRKDFSVPSFLLIKSLNRSSELVVITDSNGLIVFANNAVEKITGYKIPEIVGKKAGSKSLWGGQMPPLFYKKMWLRLNSGKSFLGVITNKKKNGDLYQASVQIYPVIHANRKYYIGIEKDLTQEQYLDKMKTDFISLASHQLRTPLSAMKWYLEMLLDGDAGKLNEEQQSFVSNINSSNERMIELINSLLNISRVESGRLIVDPKPTNIIEIVEDVIADIKIKAKERGVTFIFEGVPSLPIIISDPKLLRNVYMNLLTNAIKYTPKEGMVTLKISKSKTGIISTISDTGMGIPKKDQKKIFTRFFRAENAREKVTDGNGLGLYLVKSIIEVLNGKINFKSVEGQGSTFIFWLPIKNISAKKGEVSIDS